MTGMKTITLQRRISSRFPRRRNHSDELTQTELPKVSIQTKACLENNPMEKVDSGMTKIHLL